MVYKASKSPTMKLNLCHISLYVAISLSLCEDMKMGKMNIVVDDKLEDQFRKTVFQRKGMKKGNISDAIQEAIVNWIG